MKVTVRTIGPEAVTALTSYTFMHPDRLHYLAKGYYERRDLLTDKQRRSYALINAELVRRGLAAATTPPAPSLASTDPEALRWERLVDEALAQGLRVLCLVGPGWYAVHNPESRTGELVRPLADQAGWDCGCGAGDADGACVHVALVRWERGELPGGEQ